MRDFSSLIGTPYEKLDCWGVVVRFYQLAFGIELNPYYQDIPQTPADAQGMIYSCIKDFYRVPTEQAAAGDIILIRILGYESHIAVYLGEGKLLHTQHKTGCVIDSLSRWERLVVGFYRAKGLRND